jgi:uncharacterized protein (DUF3820 family)
MEVFMSQKFMTLTEAKAVVMTFGKHRGRTLGDVLKTDAGYLDWCYDKCRGELAEAVAVICTQCQDEIAQAKSRPREFGRHSNPRSKWR